MGHTKHILLFGLINAICCRCYWCWWWWRRYCHCPCRFNSYSRAILPALFKSYQFTTIIAADAVFVGVLRTPFSRINKNNTPKWPKMSVEQRQNLGQTRTSNKNSSNVKRLNNTNNFSKLKIVQHSKPLAFDTFCINLFPFVSHTHTYFGHFNRFYTCFRQNLNNNTITTG